MKGYPTKFQKTKLFKITAASLSLWGLWGQCQGSVCAYNLQRSYSSHCQLLISDPSPELMVLTSIH